MKGKIFLAAKFSVMIYARYNVGFPNLSRGKGEGATLTRCPWLSIYAALLLPGSVPERE